MCTSTWRLESEIEEARLKAKEEMMQSVQIAKEMVQQELSSQKEAYESKIKSLEAEVVSGHCIITQNLSVMETACYSLCFIFLS